eukprot:761654-Hanusia_phi.AAC.5
MDYGGSSGDYVDDSSIGVLGIFNGIWNFGQWIFRWTSTSTRQKLLSTCVMRAAGGRGQASSGERIRQVLKLSRDPWIMSADLKTQIRDVHWKRLHG